LQGTVIISFFLYLYEDLKMAAINFDATQVEPARGEAEVIPGGWYRGYISKTEIKATKAGDGAKLVIDLIVIDGYYAKSQVGVSLNIRNKSKIAQDIGNAELSAICHSVNVLNLQDTVQLHNIAFKFKLKISPAEGNYGPRNEVTAYKPDSTDVELVLEKQDNFLPEPVAAVAPVGFTAPAFAAQQPIPGLVTPVAAPTFAQQPAAVAAPVFTPPIQQTAAPIPAPIADNAPQPWEQPVAAALVAPVAAPVAAALVAPVAAPVAAPTFDPSAPPAWLTQPATQA
jgi:hypothetical protein